MTNHISHLKTALFANTHEISLEQALLYTTSHQQTKGKPVILHQAKATAYILEHVEISIHDEELIASNHTIKPRARIMSPEMDPYWLLKELDQFPTRPQDHFAISKEDKHIYHEELFPYWEKHSMKDFINRQMTDEVKATTSTQIFSINQTDKGQGHIIIDYPHLLNHRLGELVAQMQQHCQQQPENHFYQAALLLLEASQKHILHYTKLAETMAANCTDAQHHKELLTITEISHHNTQHKPQTFWQACQLFWYMNIILQYKSNTSSLSLGRFNQYMLPFYQTSLTQGKDTAFLKELLKSLWVKCNNIMLLRSTSSARYFASFPTSYTTLLSRLTKNRHSTVNMLSFLCLDTYQSMQLPQPNLSMHTNTLINTPFLMKTTKTIHLSTSIPQIFNNEVVVPAFLNHGISLEDARNYSIVGCVELSIPSRTYSLHDITMFNLLKVMEICLHENEGNATLTYEGLLEQIHAKISHYITLMVEGSNICNISHHNWAPVPLLSSFISNCLEKGHNITNGSTHYNFSSIQGISITNLSNSLHALKGMVFDQQHLSFDKLLSVLKANFATPEGKKVHAHLINHFEKYSNNINKVDNISTKLLHHYCKEVEKYQNPHSSYFTPGSYTISAHIPLGSVVGTTPDSHFAREQLADSSLSPMLGQDTQGPTAVLKSVSKLNNTLLSNSTLLNMKFTPATLEGEAGLHKLANFLQAFTQLKLQHIQFNMVNTNTLQEAQQHPQDYARLVVHIARYSTFFVKLSKEIQDDIIHQTAHQL